MDRLDTKPNRGEFPAEEPEAASGNFFVKALL